MIFNIFIGSIMMIATTAIHASGMMLVLWSFDYQGGHFRHWLRHFRAYKAGEAIVLLFIFSLLEVFLWAFIYQLFNAIDSMEKALYFSMVTFTTLGYGDVLLDEHWRLLGSFEAANGIIIFGWSTAIMIAIVQKNYFK